MGATLSYAQLVRNANQFAGYLKGLSTGPVGAVGLCMERSPEWIVSALGVMLAGAAYVPLDPGWPDSRLRYAIEDSGASVLIARASLLDRLALSTLSIDPSRDRELIAKAPPMMEHVLQAEDLAYIIYTSGSTGVPKGVEITHANLTHLVKWHMGAFQVGASDKASHLAGLGFDAAVWELWPHLAAGSSIAIPDEAVRSSPELMQRWLISEQITIAFVPTVLAEPMMQMQWPATSRLRFLLTGGDALHRSPSAPLPFLAVNNYGPTECTVVATSTVLQPGQPGAPPIGRPTLGTTIYLLDNHGSPVPQGEIGEIWIGGSGVARGYRNQPEATRQKFLPDPFAKIPGARMYRSGDLGALGPDGQIYFHGRVDRQVKIRGQRVELDEIGAALAQHPRVHFATAMLLDAKSAEPRLAAYVLLNEGGYIPSSRELQAHLMRTLPSYIVPSVFVRLLQLPLTSSGKLDMDKLPPPSPDNLLDGEPARTPATEVEEKLLTLLRMLLRNPNVNAEDNFFLAGGHSLLGMQMIVQVRGAFGVDLTLRQLFESPTVEYLARLIERGIAQRRLADIWSQLLGSQEIAEDSDFFDLGGTPAQLHILQRRIIAGFARHIPLTELAARHTIREQAEMLHRDVRKDLLYPAGVVPLQPHGTESPVFWLHYPCVHLAKAMDEARPFLFVTLTDEDLDVLGATPSLVQIAVRFARKLLLAQPTGAFVLGGFCLGGILAYEVACQLEAAGREVRLLTMVDTPSPEFYGPKKIGRLLRHPVHVARWIKSMGPRESVARMTGRLLAMFAPSSEEEIPAIDVNVVQSMIETAAVTYKPGKLSSKVALLLATDRPAFENFLPSWQSFIGQNLQSGYVEGSHFDLIAAPAVYTIARTIATCLASQSFGRSSRPAPVPGLLSGEPPLRNVLMGTAVPPTIQ